MNVDLEDKVVLVTGGAGGIGSVISKSFAEQGAKVIVHYNHSKDNAEKISKQIAMLELSETHVAKFCGSFVRRG